MRNYGDITAMKACGERWPRLLSPTMAAAYCKLTLSQFNAIPVLVSLVHENLFGMRMVDRVELDDVLTNEIQAIRKEKLPKPENIYAQK